MGISDTAAIVTCSACNLLEFLCFVVIIFEMSRHHSTHVRLCLSSQVDFSVHRFKESLSSQKNISSGRYELMTKILGHFCRLATVGGSVDDSQLFSAKGRIRMCKKKQLPHALKAFYNALQNKIRPLVAWFMLPLASSHNLS